MRQPGGQGWWGMVESYNEELHIVAHRQLHSSLAVVKAGPFSTEQWENLEAAFLSIVAWVEFATTSGSSLSTWTAPEPTKLRMEIETCKIGFWKRLSYLMVAVLWCIQRFGDLGIMWSFIGMFHLSLPIQFLAKILPLATARNHDLGAAHLQTRYPTIWSSQHRLDTPSPNRSPATALQFLWGTSAEVRKRTCKKKNDRYQSITPNKARNIKRFQRRSMGKRPEVPVATAIWVNGTEPCLSSCWHLTFFHPSAIKSPLKGTFCPQYLVTSLVPKKQTLGHAAHAWKFCTPRPIAGTIQNQCRPPHGLLAPCLRWRVRADSAKAPDRLTKAGPGESGCSGLPSGHEPIESRPVDGLPIEAADFPLLDSLPEGTMSAQLATGIRTLPNRPPKGRTKLAVVLDDGPLVWAMNPPHGPTFS